MRRAFVFLAAFAVGCGSSEPADDASDAIAEAAPDTSVYTDASPALDSSTAAKDADRTEVEPDAIFPVEDVGRLGTCGVPVGTTATASATGGSNVPTNAIDGKTTTFWGSGATSGTLRLAFGKLIRFDRVRIFARAVLGTPTATYTLSGRVGKTLIPLGAPKFPLNTAGTWLPDIKVTAGSYDGLDIAVSATYPTVIAEVYVYDSTAGCTPP